MHFTVRPIVLDDVDAYAAHLGAASGASEIEARFLEAVRTTFAAIRDMPEIGSPLHALRFSQPAVRKWPVQGFSSALIFYRDFPDCVEVIRVLSARQNWHLILAGDS
jgi:plasmid stabilization system protein ParE